MNGHWSPAMVAAVAALWFGVVSFDATTQRWLRIFLRTMMAVLLLLAAVLALRQWG